MCHSLPSFTTFALDTATPTPALALTRGDDVLAEMWLGRAPGGGRRVLEAAHHLFQAAGITVDDLDEIVVGLGPGGFTGIRIGIATGLGLGQARGIPVAGASSLEALALGASAARRGDADMVVPVIDARRRQVFAAGYVVGENDMLHTVIAPRAWDPNDLAAALALAGPSLVAGDGAHLVPLPTGARLAPDGPMHHVRAANLVARVRASGALPVVPAYLRLPDAEEARLRREQEGPA